MKFESQICTTFLQSERLVKLGLKPETADMCLRTDLCVFYTFPYSEVEKHCMDCGVDGFNKETIVPAWSLDRLLKLYKSVGDTSEIRIEDITYHHVIQWISLAIKHGGFNEEFLVENE